MALFRRKKGGTKVGNLLRRIVSKQKQKVFIPTILPKKTKVYKALEKLKIPGVSFQLQKTTSSRSGISLMESRRRIRVEAEKRAVQLKASRELSARIKASADKARKTTKDRELRIILEKRSAVDRQKILTERARLQKGVNQKKLSEREYERILKSFIKARTREETKTREFGFVQAENFIKVKKQKTNFKTNIIRKIISSTNKTRSSINNVIKKLPKSKSSKIRVKQTNLNKDIDSYNKKYNSKELSQLEFNKAKIESNKLTQRQKNIQLETEKVKKSTGTKIKDFLFGKDKIEMTTKQKEDIRNEIKQLEQKIKSRKDEGKSTFFSEQKIKGLKIALNKGSFTILAGDVPISPAAGINLARGVTKMQFVGKQKTVGNKIITDVVFSQGGRRIGIAKGVTIIRGNKGFTIVAGRSGVPGVKFPSAKPTIKRVQSFVSKEVGLSNAAKLKIKTQINLLNKNKNIGKITLIKNNIKGLNQVGIGQVASVRGQKFIKVVRGKKRFTPGINRDTFASFSSVITKNDLSLIIGNTITSSKNKVQFIGLIKGERAAKGLRTLSSGSTTQYQQALAKVISTASASIKQSSKVKGLSKSGVIALASTSRMVKAVIKKPTINRTPIAILKQKKAVITKQIATPKQTTIVKQRLRVKIKTTSKYITRLKSVVSTKPKTKMQQIVQTKVKLQIKQASVYLIRLSKIKKLLQKQITAKRLIFARSLMLKKIFIPIIRKKRKISDNNIKTLSKPVKVFDVVIKKRGKYVIIKKGLTERDAKNFMALELDTTLIRTAKLVPAGTRKKVTKLPKKFIGAFNKRKKKFRTFKIRRKKKITIIGYIEKRKFSLDTKREKAQLSRLIKKSKKKKLSTLKIKRKKLRRIKKISKGKKKTIKKRKYIKQKTRKIIKRRKKVRR